MEESFDELKLSFLLPILTIEDIKNHIEESRKDYLEGRYKTAEEFKEEAKKW